MQCIVVAVAVISDDIASQRKRIAVEGHWTAQSSKLILKSQLACLPSLDQAPYEGITQQSTGDQRRKNGERLATLNAGIVVRIEHSCGRPRALTVLLGAFEIGKKPILANDLRIDVEGPKCLRGMIAYVPRLDNCALDFPLNSETPLLYIGRAQLWIG